MASQIDAQFMRMAIALSGRTRALSAPNPNVGCVIVQGDRVVGCGWTQPGGRPHAEAMALGQAGAAAIGASAYVTLEPCAHYSARGSACADALIKAGVARVVCAMIDPDPRTAGQGVSRLKAAGITVDQDVLAADARQAMRGWLSVVEKGRPFITLKLATSIDGCIALANGESRWITGEVSRAHAHVERAFSNAILVGRGTVMADSPKLDVRLPGLEARRPERLVLTSGAAPSGWRAISSPEAAGGLADCHYLLVEGGAQTAASFLKAGLVDLIMLYRAPIILGGGKASLDDVGLTSLNAAHHQWKTTKTVALGSDQLEIFESIIAPKRTTAQI